MPPEYSVTYGKSTAPHDVELSRLRNEVEFDLSRYVKHKNVDAEIAAGEAEIARLKLAVQEAKAKNELEDVISGAAQCISTIATEKQDEIDRLQKSLDEWSSLGKIADGLGGVAKLTEKIARLEEAAQRSGVEFGAYLELAAQGSTKLISHAGGKECDALESKLSGPGGPAQREHAE